MEKIYVLIGEKPNSELKLIANWYIMPKQEILDTLISKFKSDYIRFALMQDILFIEGAYEEPKHIDAYY